MSAVALAIAASAGIIAVSIPLLGPPVTPWRKLVYGLLRAVALCMLALAMLRPSGRTETASAEARPLAVLADASLSMEFPHSASGRAVGRASRRERLTAFLDEHRLEFDDLRRRFAVESFVFADDLAPATCERIREMGVVSGTGTALGTALLAALDMQRPEALAGVIVLSDGVVNTGSTLSHAADVLASARVPVHAVVFGTDEPLHDLAVDSIELPRHARVGSEVRGKVFIRSTGLPGAAALKVTVDGRAVLDVTVSAEAGGGIHEFAFTPASPGVRVVQAEVAPGPQDAVSVNNVRTEFVSVEDRSLDVLYIEGVLRPDFGAVRAALAKAPGIDLTLHRAFVRGSAPILRPSGDVFVIGEVLPGALDDTFVLALARMVTEEGGGLVLLAGPNSLARHPIAQTVLGDVFTAEARAVSSIRPAVGAEDHPLADGGPTRFTAMGELGEIPTGVRLGQAARVVLEGPHGEPVLTVFQAGAGRVVVLASGTTHLWARNPDAPPGAYAQLMRAIVGWTTGRDSTMGPIALRLSRYRLKSGERVSLTARLNRGMAEDLGLSDQMVDNLRLVAELRSGAAAAPLDTAALARFGDGFTGSLAMPEETSLEDRLCRVTVASAETAGLGPAEATLVIEGETREIERLEADPSAMAALSERTGGVTVGAGDPKALFAALDAIESPRRRVAVEHSAKWDKSWVLALFAAALFTEWWMRRR